MHDIEDRRGVLYPERLPEFHRIPPTPELTDRVRWFWIPEWSLPEGTVSRQEILPFPACNLVVEPAGVSLVGPPTRVSERVLVGSGWAVGALLRPAAVPALLADPAALRDTARPLDAAELQARVALAMSDPSVAGEDRRAGAVAAVADWLRERVPEPDADGRLANSLAEVLEDSAVTRVDQLAPRLHASTRTLQRVAARAFGLSLHAMIRRRRLQEAAERLRGLRGDEAGGIQAGGAEPDGTAHSAQSADTDLSIAELANELGYSDHAHFATDFKAVLGSTPSEYRARARTHP